MQLKFGLSYTAGKSFGTTLAEIRKKLGIKQSELADQLDITAASLSRIETGESKVTVQRVARIGKVLGVRFICSFELCGATNWQVFEYPNLKKH